MIDKPIYHSYFKLANDNSTIESFFTFVNLLYELSIITVINLTIWTYLGNFI